MENGILLNSYMVGGISLISYIIKRTMVKNTATTKMIIIIILLYHYYTWPDAQSKNGWIYTVTFYIIIDQYF